jgi:hypothetical protein
VTAKFALWIPASRATYDTANFTLRAGCAPKRRLPRAVAIDLFEDQHLNIDLSGSGDLAKFHRNLLRHADDARLVLHQGNSLELAGADLVRLAEGPLRFVSVDGGHTAETTAHDLAVADAALAEGGTPAARCGAA